MDEIVLDKNLNLDDLKNLLIKLIERKEDINIIKKLLNTNKGVLLADKNILFSYVFNLSINSINNNTSDIYYYISLLKVFYTSSINKKEYIEVLNTFSDDKNEFANEIYLIILGVKRGLTPEEILNKYGIISNFATPEIFIPLDSYYDELILTIDGKKTKLRDDAISIKKDGSNYIVGIHIADSSSFVKPNTKADLIARNNYKCIYMPNSSVRMLSSDLEKCLTLDENKPRHTISMYITMDNKGDVIDYYICENITKVSKNLSYKESNDMFENYNSAYTSSLLSFYEVASLLEEKNPAKKAYWYKKENSSLDKKIINSKSDKIISELMVLYNRLISTLMADEKLPYVYRIQGSIIY